MFGDEGRELSVVGQKYDINGDGVLDETEQAMRNMDKSGKGFITNDKVYELMKHQTEMQKQIFNMKKLTIGLVVFTFILALTNLGTAWAAATLAKDTTVNTETNALEAKGNRAMLGTMSTGNAIGVEEEFEEEQGSRRLNGGKTIATVGHQIKMKDVTDKIWKGCSKSQASSVTYTCQAGSTTSIAEIECTGSKNYADPNDNKKEIYEFPQKNFAQPLLISCDEGGDKNAMCAMKNLPCASNFVTPGLGDVIPDTDSTGSVGNANGSSGSGNGGNDTCEATIDIFTEVNEFPPVDMVCRRSCECISKCCLKGYFGNRCDVGPPNKYISCAPLY